MINPRHIREAWKIPFIQSFEPKKFWVWARENKIPVDRRKKRK